MLKKLERKPEKKIMTAEQTKHYFSNMGVNSASVYLKQIQYISRLIPKNERFNILDVGCGTGIMDRELVKIFPNIRVVGIDPSEDMIIRAKHDLKEDIGIGSRLSFFCKKASEIKEKYDLIILSWVLHHLKNKKEAANLLKTLRKLVKPKGSIYICDWYRPKNVFHFKLLSMIFGHSAHPVYKQDYLNSLLASFDVNETKEILKESGIKVDYFGYWCFVCMQLAVIGSFKSRPIELKVIPMHKDMRMRDKILAMLSFLFKRGFY